MNQAGLSITEWEVVRGAIPPLSEAQWEEVFETYRQYPEYQEIHRGMSLSEFKVIYWWEYSHRMLSRFLGALFLLPFLWFVALRAMPPGDALKLAGIALLGGVQAFLGWYMVQSGLDTQPVVSHLRLGIHLVVAFLIFSMLWTMALNRIRMRNASPGKIWGGIGRTGFESTAGYGSLFHTKKANLLHIVALTAILLLFLQVLVGGWTAGLKAGYIYPTFPKMGDYWIPPQLGYFTPLWFDLTHNAITVQFIHRMLGLLLTIFILIPAIAGLRSGSGPLQLAGFALLLIITLQITTGALNLLWGVPVWLASLHQLGALLLLAALLTWLNLHSRTNSAIRNYIT